MNVVIICTDFKKMYFITISNFQTNILQGHIYLVRKHYSAILGWTNDVIQENCNIVAFV